MADKETTFCTIFVKRYLKNAKVYPQNRPFMKNGRPSSRHLSQQNEVQTLWEAWQARQIRLSNMTTKMAFVPPLTYRTSRNLFDPTLKYHIIGPYLQSRHHQCRLLKSYPMLFESWESDEANLDVPLFVLCTFLSACEGHALKCSPQSSWMSPGYMTWTRRK